MMPDAALTVTEQQFMRLLGSSNQIAQFYVYPFSISGLPRSPKTQAYINEYYASFAQLKEEGLDALVITGANVANPTLEQEPFWQPLQDVIAWATQNVTSVLCSCLATHALVKQLYKERPDFKGAVRLFHGARSGLEMIYQNDELDDFSQYYDKETFRAFKALSPRPHWEDPIAWDNALEERGAEVWSLMNDARTYVYIAGQERLGEALDKVFRKIVGDDELWERRKAEMVAGRRWAELLY